LEKNLDKLAALAKSRAQGQLSDEEYKRQKAVLDAQIFGPEDQTAAGPAGKAS
jgi:hypothetical protein